MFIVRQFRTESEAWWILDKGRLKTAQAMTSVPHKHISYSVNIVNNKEKKKKKNQAIMEKQVGLLYSACVFVRLPVWIMYNGSANWSWIGSYLQRLEFHLIIAPLGMHTRVVWWSIYDPNQSAKFTVIYTWTLQSEFLCTLFKSRIGMHRSSITLLQGETNISVHLHICILM